jgi:5-aminopentanamidase
MLRAGFLQFEPRFGRVPENLEQIESLLAGAEDALVVLPELSPSGYNFVDRDELDRLAEPVPDGPSTARLLRLARNLNLHLVVGIAEREGVGVETRFFNSAVLLTPRGYAGTYRKVHLFDREKLFFDPGDLGFPVFELDLADRPKLGIMVCFDWRFPEAARTLALAGADVIAHPSNLLKPWCQEAMVTRCLENRVFAITANRTGVDDRGGHRLAFTGRSQVVDPDGEILAEVDDSETRLAIVSLDLGAARRKTVNSMNDVLLDRRPEQYR